MKRSGSGITGGNGNIAGSTSFEPAYVVQVPWQESGDLFSVMGQKLENLGSNSIHVLEFVHQ